jgi:hypothetical protein
MTRGRSALWFAGISTAALLTACGSTGAGSPAASSTPAVSPPSTDPATPPADPSTPTGASRSGGATAEPVAAHDVITVSIGTAEFSATLADTATARAFDERLPLTLDMADVNSNEKAFELAKALPADATNPGKIHSGDLMLYGAETIVLFYESFDTSYTYTRIGRLDAPDGLAEVLGAGDVTVTFSHP